jgi:hypothetical protein
VGDGASGEAEVASDHEEPRAAPTELAHGGRDVLARRVEDADQANDGQFSEGGIAKLLFELDRAMEVDRIVRASGDENDALALARPLLLRCHESQLGFFVQWLLTLADARKI